MKQILQNLGNGETILAEVPDPGIRSGCLLIRTTTSLVSMGTEKMLVDFGKSNWLQKARSQPDKVKQVLQKIQTDGLFPTIEAVRNKLDQPLPLGYCNVGEVIEVGAGVNGFKIGDRVVSNGPHAEVVCVPKNLCAKIPENVSEESAVFTVVASIGLQGVRLVQPSIGETIVVVGLGLIGLLTVQILRANGCRVIGTDFDTKKCQIAKSFGVDVVNLGEGQDPIAFINAITNGKGADAVLITAATKSNEPIHQAAQMCRQRGRVVLVGVIGLDLQRSDFYEKEISFQVSCSYGPGRYDSDYEERGNDYPFGLVRWTEQRNFEAILELMSQGQLNAETLISHRYSFDDALNAYASLGKAGELGVVLRYAHATAYESKREVVLTEISVARNGLNDVTIGILGAGNFTGATLLPALSKTSARIKTIVSASGVTGTHLAKKFKVEISSSDSNSVFNDSEINTVFITTRHNAHASQVCKALEAGKNIFVEKPLCLTNEELGDIKICVEKNRISGKNNLLMLGFNRRFSPHIKKIKSLLETSPETKSFVMTVNAGVIPSNHWTQDIKIGGGRLLGEACHFVDLLRFLCGHKIVESNILSLGGTSGMTKDTFSIGLKFADGSIGTIHYFANGDKGFPKERLEVFCGSKILQLDNFRTTIGYGWKQFSKLKTSSQDKGHVAEMQAFVGSLKSGDSELIPLSEIFEVMKICIDLNELF